MFEMLPHLYYLYLSNSKFPITILLEITHVLNMCTHPRPADSSRRYLHIALIDIDDITSEIPSILAFIGSVLSDRNGSKNNVLVYCALGLNRSVAAVLAYMCHKKRVRASEGLEWIGWRKGYVGL
jgi:protein-tyrosine phosphatase